MIRYTSLRTALHSVLVVLVALPFASCDKWIDNASTPKNTLTREELNRPAMIAVVRNNVISDGALLANIKTITGQATAASALALGSMVDEIAPTAKPNVILYKEIKLDIIKPNGANSTAWGHLQNLRTRAEEVLTIAETLPEDGTLRLDAVRAYGRYTGHLYAGYAYMLLATTYSDDASTSGKVRIQGSFVPHEEIYRTAIGHFTRAIEIASAPALANISGAFEKSTALNAVHGLLTKLYLQLENYPKAAEHLPLAYRDGTNFSIIYNVNGSMNEIYTVLGLPAVNAEVDIDLVNALSNPAERKILATTLNKDKHRYLTTLNRYDPIVLVDDRELLLIQAELIVRGNLSGNALASINNVIGRYDSSSIESEQPTLDKIAHLRRVYLALRGARTIDYRRGMITDTAKQSTWNARQNKWLPLPELEYRK